jgi:DNA-binding NtrC family response regulator
LRLRDGSQRRLETGRTRAVARILLVDDDRNQCLLFGEALAEDAHVVTTVHDGFAAVEAVTSDRPDLVVLDINMPIMDGLDALGKILDRDPRVPVIIHTAYSSYRDNFMSAAAQEYLVKSADTSKLRESVLRVLAKHAKS